MSDSTVSSQSSRGGLWLKRRLKRRWAIHAHDACPATKCWTGIPPRGLCWRGKMLWRATRVAQALWP